MAACPNATHTRNAAAPRRPKKNVVQKTGQTAYPLWDIDLARNTGSLRPYLRLLNLSNTGYQEIPTVPMQGRTIMGGLEINWTRH